MYELRSFANSKVKWKRLWTFDSMMPLLWRGEPITGQQSCVNTFSLWQINVTASLIRTDVFSPVDSRCFLEERLQCYYCGSSFHLGQRPSTFVTNVHMGNDCAVNRNISHDWVYTKWRASRRTWKAEGTRWRLWALIRLLLEDVSSGDWMFRAFSRESSESIIIYPKDFTAMIYW